MNCNEARELLAAAVLGDLEVDQRRTVHAHLAGCDRCLAEENELFQSLHLLRAHGDVDPGEGFHASVMARAFAAAADDEPAPVVPIRQVGLLTQTLLTAAATALIVVGLQTVLESWHTAPASSPAAGYTVNGAAPRLLEGTLFDRRRDIPEELRCFREQLRSGDAERPLEL